MAWLIVSPPEWVPIAFARKFLGRDTSLLGTHRAQVLRRHLLAQLADLRSECTWGESDRLPYRLQAERSWRELLACREERNQLRERLALLEQQ